MRNGLLLPVLFLLLLTSAVHAQEFEPAWLEVANVALRLREGPSTDDGVITRLTPREAVELLEQGEEWSRIRRHDGQSGWAHNDYLLPWDERNRPDAQRRVGERRLFRVAGSSGGLAHAELRAVSDNSYIYAVARRASSFLPDDRALQRLGGLFDERVYRQALDLWGIEDPPHILGDERIPILVASGFDPGHTLGGWYFGRDGLPNESSHAGTGFLGIMLHEANRRSMQSDFANLVMRALAHEYGHLLHHHVGGRNRGSLYAEGLAEFTRVFLQFGQEVPITKVHFPGPTVGRDLGISSAGPCVDYHTGMLFASYIHERFGAETLQRFASHPRMGMHALDDLLAEGDEGMDASDFYADWALANHLLDTRRENGRFGYSLMPDLQTSAALNPIRQLPVGLRDSSYPYTAKYYELPLTPESGSHEQLLLDFRLQAPQPQDAWIQFVQVLPDSIDVRRFRASDYRGRPILAPREPQAERAFLAVSPFIPGEYHHNRPVHYSFSMHEIPPQPDDRAQVTASLRVRNEAQPDAPILGKLRPCSWVQVLQRGDEWSQVLADDGLSGWSHNDYLFHLNAPSAGAPAFNCATLTRAAWNGSLASVQNLLASGADVNDGDAFGRTALHEAAFWGHDRIIDRLLRAGADIHAQDAAGRTPLDDVLRSRDTGSILRLHRARENFHLGDPELQPLVIMGAASGNGEFVELLLDNGHDVNWRDDRGRTALAAAAANGQERVLRTLIDAGADVSLADGNGRTPFMHAAARGNLVTLERIHRAGVDVNHVDREGHSALTLAAANGQTMNVAWLLLSTDVDVHHALPDSGRTALHLAAARGHADVIAMLLLGDADHRRNPQPVDAGARDAEGFTPLQLATAAGHARAATRLNMMETDKLKPKLWYHLGPEIHAAVRSGDLAEIESLIRADAWISATDREGYTPLMRAAQAGNRDVVLRLLLAGADPDERDNWQWDEPAMFFTIRSGDDDLTAMLLLAGSTGRTRGNAALQWSASFGRADVVRLLLDLKTPRRFNVTDRNYPGQTPLHHAVNYWNLEVVELLLDSGADPNARTGPILDRRSVLEVARRGGNRQIIDLLLAAGAEA
ncbi:MAG: ankyrin repeat domain-containing protein [Anaerolineaceae bacterium]|nr:ankyrin repeat domain-containing protein [Anaerolineaceae bacterium]